MTEIEKEKSITLTDPHVGCFGEYNVGDMICKKFCALRLRCAITQDQQAKMELIEDLISYDDMNIKLQ